jgi:hypothetical protein
MATIRKRAAKIQRTGTDRSGLKGTAADASDGGEIGETRKAPLAGAPAPVRELKPNPFEEQRVRDRAYAIWIAEGRPDGRDIEHWLRARGEIERDAA